MPSTGPDDDRPFMRLRYWMGWCCSEHESNLALCEKRRGHEGKHTAPWTVNTATLETVHENLQWD
jgi:hypothetical protein